MGAWRNGQRWGLISSWFGVQIPVRPPSQAAISRAIPVPSGLVPLCVLNAGAWAAGTLKGGYLGNEGAGICRLPQFSKNDYGEREC